jgi:hypothetical protein
MPKTKKSKVGRPKNSEKLTDSALIHEIIMKLGVRATTEVVKREYLKRKAIDVKIAQVRSKLIQEQTGIKKQKAGRRSIAEQDQVAGALLRQAG